MRGIPSRSNSSPHSSGIIPAHAGNTNGNTNYGMNGEDHPRSCGEYFRMALDRSRRLGSSPLMRGIQKQPRRAVKEKRIIPAHAGNTVSVVFTFDPYEDHPRSCGEYIILDNLQLHNPGSSPLMRGILLSRPAIQRKSRIIPAHAGNTKFR